jgi:hypothetical protein
VAPQLAHATTQIQLLALRTQMRSGRRARLQQWRIWRKNHFAIEDPFFCSNSPIWVHFTRDFKRLTPQAPAPRTFGGISFLNLSGMREKQIHTITTVGSATKKHKNLRGVFFF